MYLKIGDKVPDFKLKNYDDSIVTLDDLLGKPFLLWFFPKASTPGWTVQGEGFRDEFKKFNDKDIEIIGVSADKPSKQKKFVEKYNFPFKMLCDESHEMLKSYKAWGLKKFMGREYEGIHRITYIIDESGKIVNVFEKVKTKTHADDILNELSWAILLNPIIK